MGRRRLAVLLGFGLTGAALAGLRVYAPSEYKGLVSEGRRLLSDVPEPVLIGAAAVLVVAMWISVMILVARVLYWGWKQIDDRVFWLWNLVLPESPLIRFAVGLVVLLVLFGLGPLLVLQTLDVSDDEDPINESMENETAPNESADGERDVDDANESGTETAPANESSPRVAAFEPPGRQTSTTTLAQPGRH